MEQNLIVTLGRTYAEKRRAHEAAKTEIKKLAEAEEEAENELIEALIEAGTKSISIEGVGRLTLSRSTYPSVNAAGKPTFFEYLKEAGHGGLLKLDVNPQTLQSFLKKHVVEIQQQLSSEGLSDYQAEILNQGAKEQYHGVKAGTVIDEMDAEEMARDILIAKGAAMFTKRGISLVKD